jgi:hypothetical protein
VSAHYYLGEEFGSTSALENLASLDQIERTWVGRVTPVRAVLSDCIATAAEDCPPYLLLFPSAVRLPQWRFVFTVMTLELGLVPFPL